MKTVRWLFAAVLLAMPGSALADYYDGLRAYDSKDFATAFAEWRTSADAGDANSQFRLGQLFEDGLGAPQNFIQAHVYYNLAGAQGHDEARAARDALAAQMTKAVLGEAMTECRLEAGVAQSFELLRDLLILQIESGKVLNQDDFEQAIFC